MANSNTTTKHYISTITTDRSGLDVQPYYHDEAGISSHSDAAQPSRDDFEARQSTQLVTADTSGSYAAVQLEEDKHPTSNLALKQIEGIQTRREISILVLGETGSGKSSLIKQVTGSPVKIGHSLKSCRIYDTMMSCCSCL